VVLLIKTYLSGNTIRFQATFKNYNNELVNPDLVEFIIYNSKEELLHRFEATNLSLGIYYYDFNFSDEDKNRRFIVEMRGIINNKPCIEREEIMIKFKK